MLGLHDPWVLVLIAAPLVAWRLLPGARSEGAAMRLPAGLDRTLAQRGPGQGPRAMILPLLIWAGLVLALAGPHRLTQNPALPVTGRDIVLALDLSGSMVREDFELNGQPVQRLAAVKHAAARFVEGRAGDRLALVIFASRAYFATPQTFDIAAVSHAIETAEIGIAGRATGISEGIGLALKRLAASEAATRVIILLSDGVHNSGPAPPRGAARLARSLGVRIHTIAMGPRDLETANGERDAVDAVTLEAIASLSGGEYFRVRTTDDLLAVTEAIDRLETDTADGPAALLHHELWVWPAAAALLLALGLAARELRS